MIVVDLSGIMVASAAIAYKLDGKAEDPELDRDNIRHLALNSIRQVNKKYKKKYGELVIAIDNREYWRRGIFPAYKAARKEKRKKNDQVPWAIMYEVITELKVDFKEVFGYNVIDVTGAEADDVIGVLSKYKSEQQSTEDVMIISNDGDFKQLQKFPNIKQFSTMKGKLVIESDPAYWLKEKCIRGDKKDGIPNIYSKLNHFVETPEIRQKSVTKKFLGEIMNIPVEAKLGEAEIFRYKQNEILLNFEKIPKKIRSSIIDEYLNHEPFNNKSKVFDYLMSNGMGGLVDCTLDFTNG